MATIESIPLEVLSKIFRLLAEEAKESWIQHLKLSRRERAAARTVLHSDDDQAHRVTLGPYTWTRVSGVSRSWRAIALDDPLLWTHVAVVGRETTEEMINRAAGLLLTVTANPRRDVQTLQWILETYPAQIKMVVMPIRLELLAASFTTKASNLRTLLFVGSVAAGAHRELPDALIPFHTLTHLENTTDFLAPVVHLCADTLKVLVLTSKRSPYLDFFIPLADLMRALSNTPLLEYLDVEVSYRTRVPPGLVELPHLATLRLAAETSACVAFLRLVRVPGAIEVTMNCHNAPVDVGRGPSILGAVHTAATDGPATSASSFDSVLAVAIRYDGVAYELRGWRTSALLLQGPQHDPAPDVALFIPCTAAVSDVRQLLTTMPLRHTQSLRFGPLHWAEGGEAVRCAKALCALPQLRRITLDAVTPELASELAEATTAESLALANVGLYDNHPQLAEDEELGGSSQGAATLAVVAEAGR